MGVDSDRKPSRRMPPRHEEEREGVEDAEEESAEEEEEDPSFNGIDALLFAYFSDRGWLSAVGRSFCTIYLLLF